MSCLLPALALGAKLLGCGLVIFVVRGAIWLLNMLVFAPRFDPLRNLPGADGAFWEKHLEQLMDPNVSPQTHEEWVGKYGTTWRFQGFGAFDYRLMTFDFRALNHIIGSPVYEKPWQTRKILSKLLGRGVFAMEGQEHRWQRKLIGPAFTVQNVRSLSPIFLQKAEELRDCWDKLIGPDECDKNIPYPTPPSTPSVETSFRTETSFSKPLPVEKSIIDVVSWASRATFDVIGLAGFDYSFNSLRDDTEKVCMAYRKMFEATERGPGLKGLLSLWFPFIETLSPDDNSRVISESLKVIGEAGKLLVENKRALILAEKSSAKDIQDKDLLSLLIKANMSENPSKRMSDTEIMDQLTTFLFAGSDTTSLAIAWCIHLLSTNMQVQERLRQEILSLSHKCRSSTLDANVINSMPLLDAVVRETLRINPPVHGTIRVATKDDVIPLSEPTTLRDGTVTQEIHIRKGSYIHIPIEGLNTNKDLWGEDAHEFNPDRWIKKKFPSRHPGLHNLMTFSYGAHACVGSKFSMLETKFFIATLLPHFVFEPAEEIKKFNSIMTRPYVADKFELGTSLPVKVSRYCAC